MARNDLAGRAILNEGIAIGYRYPYKGAKPEIDVALTDYAGSTVRYAHLTSQHWKWAHSLIETQPVGWEGTTLAIDPLNAQGLRLHVVYLDRDSHVRHAYKRDKLKPAAPWLIHQAAETHVQHRPGVAVDEDGGVHIVFQGYNLMYVYHPGCE